MPAVVVTSIPPRLTRHEGTSRVDREYQKICVQSWLDCGLRVVSVNDPEEIKLLTAHYPEVSFVPAGRSASALTGRTNPYVADLLGAAADAREPVAGILNSDILLEPGTFWRQQLPTVVAGAVLVGRRHDVHRLADGALKKYAWGLDFFFFEKSSIGGLLETAQPYAMGVPWWDYWLPAALACQGRVLKRLDRPAILHLFHEQGYNWDLYRRIGLEFCRFVCSVPGQALPEWLKPLVPMCAELARVEPVRQVQAAYERLSSRFVETIHAVMIPLETKPAHQEAPAPAPRGEVLSIGAPKDAFRQFERRLRAGDELAAAVERERKRELDDAALLYQSVLAIAPAEPDALASLGRILLAKGQAKLAAPLLRRACTEQRQPSARTLTTLGAALAALGARDEAIEWLQKALAAEPAFAAAHFHMAGALEGLNRKAEAVTHLEKALALNPALGAGRAAPRDG